ncbi:tigger transposable element-derived protein 6-like [Bactrocera tryoni]|uniref:tigger transposable element-derived protein 6-like n=1 Tax=Bactrocera tryoni TaxID=59916 RepID=UPI001A97CE44|nr:tigger transposable element-derived protein 6-like [Bactrocera tryoni]
MRKMARSNLSLKEKIELINVSEENNLSVRALAERFKIGKTQAALVIKNKEEIRTKWMSGSNVESKRSFMKIDGKKVDEMCLDWFNKARSQNIPISGPIIQEKAREIARKLGIKDFVASNGWLQKWRSRHNITFKYICGESAAVDMQDVQQFLDKLPSFLIGYSPRDVYNADETGLFFRALPNKTLALKNEVCRGGKLSKERLTVLLCANMAGEKEKPLVIGKAARPRAFASIDLKKLPVNWQSNKKAWMTREVMTQWLKEIDKKMELENRKVLLFLDNAASHPRDISLKNVKILFLPSNTTSVCQPLDQGIIQNFKIHYRNSQVKNILVSIETGSPKKNINVLEAIHFIKEAWTNVQPQTIKNCFQKAGFDKNRNLAPEFDPEDDLPLSTLASIFELSKALGECTHSNPDDFVQIDNNAWTESSDFELDVIIDETIETIDDNSTDNESTTEERNEIFSNETALTAVSNLKRFCSDDLIAFGLLQNLESHLQNNFLLKKQKNLSQSTITQFFKQ